MWHLKCLLPSGVHVSAKMFESLRRPCVNLHLASRTSHFASKCLSPCGVHVSPKMFLWFCQANMLCCYFVLSDFVASRFLWFCQASLLRASEWTSEWVSQWVSPYNVHVTPKTFLCFCQASLLRRLSLLLSLTWSQGSGRSTGSKF